MKMVNIKDIAKKAGMSPSTVSRVVNGKRYVNAEKRKHILELIEETGYVPNKAARSMVMQRSFTVGIIIPGTFNVFQRQLFSIIERHLESFGYHTMFFFVKTDGASEEACVNRLKAEKMDGLILLHEMRSSFFYDYVEQRQIPVVATLVNRSNLATVKLDDEKAAREGVTHLVNLGHRRITMICGSGFTFGERRLQGYYQALETSGAGRDERRVIMVPNYTAEFGMYGMRELLLRGRDFTAVFAASDELAIGAIRVLKDEGIRVPEDVSVIGFDDIDITNYIVPRLTTVRQPIAEIGEQSVLALHRSISGQTALSLDLVLPHRLIIRESTARIT
jgi:LacI family transcriptional regulator